MLKIFVLGVLVGWLAQWLIARFWRRPPSAEGTASDVRGRDAGLPHDAGFRGDGAGRIADAGTTAGEVGADVAVGAPGAVSTSSATLTTHAPVFRQIDLEAIPSLSPRLATMLRHHGIATFRQLADAPSDELARLVLACGDEPDATRIDAWREQAGRAARRDWAGFAAASRSGA